MQQRQTAHAGIRPIFLKTTAIGSLMRRKIQPVVTPLLDNIAILRRG